MDRIFLASPTKAVFARKFSKVRQGSPALQVLGLEHGGGQVTVPVDRNGVKEVGVLNLIFQGPEIHRLQVWPVFRLSTSTCFWEYFLICAAVTSGRSWGWLKGTIRG